MTIPRITHKHLTPLILQLNDIAVANSTPAHPCQLFHLQRAYGGYQLYTVSAAIGYRSYPLAHGYICAREMYNALQAFIAGIHYAKPESLIHVRPLNSKA